MLGSMDSPSSSEETVLRRESQSSLIRQAAELAADRPAEMMSEKEIEQARQARALADAASAGGKSPSGRSPITERRASRVPHGTRPTAEFDADAAFWQGHGANAISAAAFAYDRSGKVEIGTPGDHFSLAWEHIKEGFSLLFKAMLPAASPGPSSPHRPRSPEKPVGSGDDDEDEEETMKRIVREAGVILPTDPWKEMWDVFILVLIIYSAIAVPYRICFESPASGMVWIFEQLLTAAFMVDVGFNFNTAHSDNADSWVTDRREIALRYLSGWFWIDAPACVPVELLDAVLAGEQKQMGLLRFLRLFRLIRLLRLLKVGEYVANLEEKFDINLTFLRIATMLLKLVFLSHILACFWFYVAFLAGLDEDIPTWVSDYDNGSGLYEPAHIQYLYAMYWALTTLTTVGYGDIIPVNNAERFYALFALLIGALVFGYMLSSIGSLVAALDRQAALSEEKMDAIKEYMRWRKFPRDLTVRMRRYYEYFYERKTAFDEGGILDGLTPPLRLEVVRHLLRETIGKIPLFKQTLDVSFQLEIFPLFKPVSAGAREVIYSKGEPSHGLFFLLKGRAEAISCLENRVLYSVKQGQSFGESVLTGRRRAATMRAISPCEMYTISATDLQSLFCKRPREGRLMHASLVREHNRKEKMRALSLRMLMNKLAYRPSPETAEMIAALRLQLVWCRVTETLSMAMMPIQAVEDDAEERTLSEKILEETIVPPGVQTPGGTPASPGTLLRQQNTATGSGSVIGISPVRITAAPATVDRHAAPLSETHQKQPSGVVTPPNRQALPDPPPLSLKRVADLQSDMKKLLKMVGDMQEQLPPRLPASARPANGEVASELLL